MSAISGIYNRNGRNIDPNLIKNMNNALSHRGPDGSDILVYETIAFGHQMLQTTHESIHEKLPIEDKNSGLIITADARIDNREELSKELDIENNEKFSDSYFILKAYQKWNENCPKKLLGDFTFVIYDKHKEELFCARDHMGVKPFYYYLSDNAFYFATEIKAILSIPELSFEINEVRVAQYLLSELKDREITFYKEIFRLPAAHSIKINSDGFVLDKYWSLDPDFELKLPSDEDYVNKFREIFMEAVKCRLRSNINPGFLLSGGLDSSSIVCTAKKILNADKENYLKTFSATFDDVPQCDEKEFINAIVSEGYIEPHYIRADMTSPLVDYKKVFFHEDEPFFAANLFLNWCLLSKANKEGINIILDGFDGDSTISYGKGYFNELLKSMNVMKFVKESFKYSKLRNLNSNRFFIGNLIENFTPKLLKKIKKYRVKTTINPQNLQDIINEQFSHEINIDEIVNSVPLDQINAPKKPRDHHYNRINSGLLQFGIEINDKIGGAFGIEQRYPFFDVRLIEFCLSLPTQYKLSEGWDRIILRRAMNNILPPKIQWRILKSKLGANFRRNFMLYEKELIEKMIYQDYFMIEKYVDEDVLKRSYKLYQEICPKKNKSVMNVWKAITLGLWLKDSQIKK